MWHWSHSHTLPLDSDESSAHYHAFRWWDNLLTTKICGRRACGMTKIIKQIVWNGWQLSIVIVIHCNWPSGILLCCNLISFFLKAGSLQSWPSQPRPLAADLLGPQKQWTQNLPHVARSRAHELADMSSSWTRSDSACSQTSCWNICPPRNWTRRLQFLWITCNIFGRLSGWSPRSMNLWKIRKRRILIRTPVCTIDVCESPVTVAALLVSHHTVTASFTYCVFPGSSNHIWTFGDTFQRFWVFSSPVKILFRNKEFLRRLIVPYTVIFSATTATRTSFSDKMRPCMLLLFACAAFTGEEGPGGRKRHWQWRQDRGAPGIGSYVDEAKVQHIHDMSWSYCFSNSCSKTDRWINLKRWICVMQTKLWWIWSRSTFPARIENDYMNTSVHLRLNSLQSARVELQKHSWRIMYTTCKIVSLSHKQIELNLVECCRIALSKFIDKMTSTIMQPLAREFVFVADTGTYLILKKLCITYGIYHRLSANVFWRYATVHKLETWVSRIQTTWIYSEFTGRWIWVVHKPIISKKSACTSMTGDSQHNQSDHQKSSNKTITRSIRPSCAYVITFSTWCNLWSLHAN